MALPDRSFGFRICKALGLDPERVTAINIKLSVGELVTVDVCRLVSAEEADRVLEVLEEERFTLEKIQ
jgi:hypothetical protein